MSDTVDLSSLHRDRSALESALKDAGATIRGTCVKCPFHDDQHPSASIYVGEDGAWRFKCHVCKVCEDVIGIRAMGKGRSSEDELRSMREHEEPKKLRLFPSVQAVVDSINAYSQVERHYVYTNPQTRLPDMVVFRCHDSQGRKTFLQGHSVEGGVVMKAPPKPWPLYNRLRIATAETVIVVEGEKCVHALADIGVVATTSPCGAGKSMHADWTPLAGKTVHLWPDNDATGISHMREVASELRKLDPLPVVNWIEPESLSLPEKGDVVDYLEQYGGETAPQKAESVRCAMDIATSFGPSASVRRLVEDTISGKRYAAPWPWAALDRLTNSLLPGTVTAICGDPGSSKSFMLIQAARHWHKQSIKFAMYQLEADEDGSHLMRALAQESGCGAVMEWKWLKENADQARQLTEKYRGFLDSFGSRLWTPPEEPPHIDALVKWVKDRAEEGCRVIVVDPITAADTSKSRWDDDRRFIINCQRIMRDHGASLIVVSHPKQGNKDGKMSDMAGGAAYSRFTQTVLWLKTFDPPKDANVIIDANRQPTTIPINRSIKIAKARLGAGGGCEIGFRFGEGLKFAQQGVIVKKKSVKREIEEASNAAD